MLTEVNSRFSIDFNRPWISHYCIWSCFPLATDPTDSNSLLIRQQKSSSLTQALELWFLGLKVLSLSCTDNSCGYIYVTIVHYAAPF